MLSESEAWSVRARRQLTVYTTPEALDFNFNVFFLLWPSFLRGFGSDCLAGRSILPRRSEDHLWRCQTPGQSYVDTFIHVNTYIPWASMGIHGPQQPTFLEVLMENNLVFRWPKPLFLMALGAHGNYLLHRLKIHTDLPAGPTDGPT